jgi:hypothetical protein
MIFQISVISVPNWPIVRLKNSKGAKQKVEQPDKFAAKFCQFCSERAEKWPNI